MLRTQSWLLLMENGVYNVLFLCTGNSARSIMAEALMATLGNGKFKAYSAGSHPTGQVNALAIEMVKKTGYSLENLRSKNWDEFAVPGAPKMDFIFTVCDNAAGEVCPVWPGRPVTAHWGFEDPAAVQGSEEKKRRAFQRVFRQISSRIELFLTIPIEQVDHASLHKQLSAIGNN